jgi:hypothetical protein
VHVRDRRLILGALRLGVLRDQQPLGEVERVGRGQHRHQLQLLRGVVEDSDLGRVGRAELGAERAVADRDRDRALEDADRGGGEAHAPAGELAERGREAAAGRRERRGVAPVRVDGGKAVEEVAARDARAREANRAVVDAVEADLGGGGWEGRAGCVVVVGFKSALFKRGSTNCRR